MGHYVNYRKQSSPSLDALSPVEDFRLYAVSTRHPEKLETEASLIPVKEGVYEIQWGSRRIRLIVLSEVAKIERNAVWQLFSGIPKNVRFGANCYRWRQKRLSTVMSNLFDFYHAEGFAMPYTVEDYERDLKEKVLKQLTAEERLKGLPPEERLKGLSPEEILKRLTREQIEDYLKKLKRSH